MRSQANRISLLPASRSRSARSRSASCAVGRPSGRLPRKCCHSCVIQPLRVELATPACRRRTASRPASTCVEARPTSAASRWPAGPARRSTPRRLMRASSAASRPSRLARRSARNSSVVTEVNACRSNQDRSHASNLAAADRLLDQSQQRRALVVGNRGHAVVGVAAGEDEVQVRVLRAGAEPGDLVDSSRRPSTSSIAVALGAVERFHDPALEVDGEAFVQPEVAPRRVGDEVARPRVRELVRDERHSDRSPARMVGVANVSAGSPCRRTGTTAAAPARRSGPSDTGRERLGGRDHLLEVGELARGASTTDGSA